MILLLLACAGAPQESPTELPPPAPVQTSEEASEPASGPLLLGKAGEDDHSANIERFACRQILVTYEDSIRSRSDRSEAEALALAEALRARVLAGEDMADLAAEYSEDMGSRNRGGWLGSSSRGRWVKPFEDAVLALSIGEVGEVLETPYGFHVIRRESIAEIKLRQILVQFEGNYTAAADGALATRSREEALSRIERAAAALAEGGDFVALADTYSDGPMAHRGGDLGFLAKGELGRDFDEAAFALAVGETSAIIETPFGFHLVQRIE